MYKKVIIIMISLILITGCSDTVNINNAEIDTIIENVTSMSNKAYNVNSKGFRYYLPRDFRLLEENDYNHTLVNNGNKYYLHVDIISYQSKKVKKPTVGENARYITEFTTNDKYGYVEINKKNSYFYIKMMYNYSVIEVEVEESEVKDAIMYMSTILSSIKYNDVIIDNVISKNILETKENKYEIFTPTVKTEKKNFLEYVEQYDTYYDSNQKVIDTDLIN